MSTYDYEPNPWDDEEPKEITCNRCGKGPLEWRRVTQPDGRSEKSVLFDERGFPHRCNVTDDFDDLT